MGNNNCIPWEEWAKIEIVIKKYIKENPSEKISFTDLLDTVDELGAIGQIPYILEVDGKKVIAFKNLEDSKVNTNGRTVTKTTGSILAGTTYNEDKNSNELIENMLFGYIASSLLSITISPGTTIEVGKTITIVSASLSYVKDSENKVPYNAVITGDGFNGVVVLDGNSIPAAASTTVTKNTNTSASWVFTAEDKNGNALASKSDSIYWYFRRFFGASSLLVTDDASANILINSLQQSALDANRACTVYCTSDNNDQAKFTYIVYAAKFGDLTSIIQDGATPVLGAFTKIGSYNFTNAESHVELYNIYKSNSEGAFSDGVKLDIS